MTRLLRAAAALLCLLASSAYAQTFTVSGSKLADSGGALVSNATITFAPVGNSGAALSYRRGGGGQSTTVPKRATVTNGAFSLTLPDVSQTVPLNVCFAVTVRDNVSGAQLLGPGYGCVQPSTDSSQSYWCSGGVCNFDLYHPAAAAGVTQTAGPAGPAGVTGAAGPAGAPGAPGTTDYNGANGPFRAQQLNGVGFADKYSGAEGGARVNAALAALGGPGEIQASPSVGSFGTAVTIGDRQVLHLQPGIYPVSAPITLSGASASIECSTTSDTPGGLAGSCILQAVAGSNLSNVVILSGTNASLRNVTIDGQQFAAINGFLITNGGSGYMGSATISVAGCSTAPQIQALVVNGTIWSNYAGAAAAGRGCTGTPVCTITGTGTGATCSASFGPNLNPTGGPVLHVTGLRNKLEIVNVTQSPSHGVYLDGTNGNGTSTSLSHVTALFNSGDGAFLQNTYDVNVDNLSAFEQNLGDGFAGLDAGGVRITHSDFAGNGGHGIVECGIANGHTTGSCPGTEPANHRGGSNWMISGSQVAQNGLSGMYMPAVDTVNGGYTATNHTIIGNTFFGPALGGVPAIDLPDQTSTIVSSNNISDSSTAPYTVAVSITGADSPTNVVSSNVFSTSGATKIIHTAHTVITGNAPDTGGAQDSGKKFGDDFFLTRLASDGSPEMLWNHTTVGGDSLTHYDRANGWWTFVANNTTQGYIGAQNFLPHLRTSSAVGVAGRPVLTSDGTSGTCGYGGSYRTVLDSYDNSIQVATCMPGGPTLIFANNSFGLGLNALDSLTGGGGGNTAFGKNALHSSVSNSQNTAFGGAACQSCASDNNTALGYGALSTLNNSGGSSNVGVGTNAGTGVTACGGCTFVGVNSGSTTDGVYDCTAVGENTKCTAVQQVMLGDSDVQTMESYGAIKNDRYVTAPTGTCTVNGAWALSQDGHATFCASGTWVTKI